jgi:multiple sugar transport system permease protein
MMRIQDKEKIHAVVLIIPSLIFISVFSLIPIFMDIAFSFSKYNIVQAPTWIGLANYQRLVKDSYVIASFKNTIIYMLLTVPAQTIISLLLAVVLAELFRNKFGEFVRGSLFIPVIASSILTGTLWSLLFFAHQGLINQFIGFFGIKEINWLGAKQTAMLSISVVAVWKDVGYFLVIFYAGIMDIPITLYEAARVDGATGIQRFFYITIPSLKRVTYMVVTLGTIWSFQVFDTVYVMTKGGPGMATITMVLAIYNAAFKEYNMGYASAIALLMFFFILILSIAQKYLMREGSEE